MHAKARLSATPPSDKITKKFLRVLDRSLLINEFRISLLESGFCHFSSTMDQYLTCLGSSALSDFRRKALASRLDVSEVRARFLHYLALKPSEKQQQADYDPSILQELLTYGDDDLEDEIEEGNEVDMFFVFPRSGTISPWSSQATS